MLIPVLALSLAALSAPTVGAGECVVVAPLDGPETVVGAAECSRRTLPASTFKIPHALIGLQTQVVTDKTVMKWDGKKQDFPAWERDHTLDSAITSSVVWFFQRMAVSIGRERELEQLRAFHYGSASFEREVTSFWLNDDLTVSPLDQVAFLRRMFSYALPVERRHIDTVKTALTMPRGKLSNATGVRDFGLQWPDTIVRVKTGNGTVNGERVSWLVGALETGGKQYVFASRARSASRVLDTTAGADLALRVLNTINPAALPSSQTAPARTHGLVELWAQGKPAFGVYAPNENPGPRGQRGQPPQPVVYTRESGEKLAMNPLYDYVFLNLEGSYDAAAVKAMADGLRSPNAVSRKALIVRIPPIDKDGAASAKARVKEALDLGADGVTIPHVQSLDEAKLAISFSRMRKHTSGRRRIRTGA
jgi:beta-lactamase class D